MNQVELSFCSASFIPKVFALAISPYQLLYMNLKLSNYPPWGRSWISKEGAHLLEIILQMPKTRVSGGRVQVSKLV